VFVAGVADAGYPTTPGAFDEAFNVGNFDVIASKLTDDLAQKSIHDRVAREKAKEEEALKKKRRSRYQRT
jgi:hypothetical protein